MSWTDAWQSIRAVCAQVGSSEIRDGVSVIRDLIIASVAVWGVTAWRRQLQGTAQYQTAVRVLKALYSVQQTVWESRFPVRFDTDEMFKRGSVEISDEQMTEEELRSYYARVKAIETAVAELRLAGQEAWSYWGDEATEALEPFDELLRNLQEALNAVVVHERAIASAKGKPRDTVDSVTAFFAKRTEEAAKARAILIQHEAEDEIIRNLARDVKRAEDFFRRRLKSSRMRRDKTNKP